MLITIGAQRVNGILRLTTRCILCDSREFFTYLAMQPTKDLAFCPLERYHHLLIRFSNKNIFQTSIVYVFSR